MKKVLTVLFMVMLCVSVSNAQKGKLAVSVGPEILIPGGDFGDLINTGFGATVRGEYILSKKLVGTVDVGYFTFGEGDAMNLGFFKR